MQVEPRPIAGQDARVLVQRLAKAYRDHEIRTGETPHQVAKRNDIPHQRIYEVLNRANDPTFDPGALKLERLAKAIGLEWKLEPAAPEKGST